MIASDIVTQRLYNQRIAPEKCESPGRVASLFGGMQAQDYASVKWAIGLRCRDATDSTIEQAIADKSIVRTWLMRGTLHIAAASDVRWMLDLLAPRLIARSARRCRQLELDDAQFAASQETLTTVLQENGQLTREEMMLALEEAGISTGGQRGYYMLRRAGLDGLICFGPVQDGQETFVLLDEWAPHGKKMERDEALAELAGRYFGSHGPATLKDFVWWSGLKVADARTALEMAETQLRQETLDGQTYWLPLSTSIPKEPSPAVYLLPAFDEYYLGYRERSAVLDASYDQKAVSSGGVFRPMIVLDGQIVGVWKQSQKKDSVIITPTLFDSLTEAENQVLLAAAKRYGAFLGQSVTVAQ